MVIANNSDHTINNLILSGKFKLAKNDLDKFELGKFIAEYIKGNPFDSLRSFRVNFVGGAASGKNTIVQCIIRELPQSESLDLDDFSVGKTREERNAIKDARKKTDYQKLNSTAAQILKLAPQQKIKISKYDTTRGVGIYSNLKRTIIGSVKYLLVQGIYAGLVNPDLQIYFHLSDKERLRNRLKRDMIERGYKNRGEIIKSFQSRQLIEHFPHTLPESQKSNILILTQRIKSEKFTFNVHLLLK